MAPGATPGATRGLREVDPSLVRRPRSTYVRPRHTPNKWPRRRWNAPGPGTEESSSMRGRFSQSASCVSGRTIALDLRRFFGVLPRGGRHARQDHHDRPRPARRALRTGP